MGDRYAAQPFHSAFLRFTLDDGGTLEGWVHEIADDELEDFKAQLVEWSTQDGGRLQELILDGKSIPLTADGCWK
jgi:hypothetical protein